MLNANPKSYHFLEASETVGDLLAADGKYVQAAEYYARLNAAPWPDYKMRTRVAAGRLLLAQGKAREAAAMFDKVIANPSEGDLAQAQRHRGRAGEGRRLVALQKPDEAIKIVEALIAKADPENAPLVARAYNVLGTAQRQAGRVKEALLAFLHVNVDPRYSAVPEAHAEALANLAELWQQVHRTDRAARAPPNPRRAVQREPLGEKERRVSRPPAAGFRRISVLLQIQNQKSPLPLGEG